MTGEATGRGAGRRLTSAFPWQAKTGAGRVPIVIAGEDSS